MAPGTVSVKVVPDLSDVWRPFHAISVDDAVAVIRDQQGSCIPSLAGASADDIWNGALEAAVKVVRLAAAGLPNIA